MVEPISACPVAECSSATVADALTRAFEGYLLPFRVTAEQYERRFRAEDLDPFASRIYYRDDTLAGILLLARRGWTSRIAAMAVAPGLRGQGLGRRMLQDAIRDAQARGDRALLLEVFERNAAAVGLYSDLGFQSRRRLVGYRREPIRAAPGLESTLKEADPAELARLLVREGSPELPWMLAPETLSAATAPARMYHLERRAYALVGDPGLETLALVALLVPRSQRRQGWGTRLLQALGAAFPDRPWVVPAIVPEELAPTFFMERGWRREELSQLEMRLELS